MTAYRDTSIEGRFLAGDPEAVGTVNRWISLVLTSPRFWSLRSQWLDLHQEVMKRALDSLRHERFDDSSGFRAYVQAVARYTALQALDSHYREGIVVALNPDARGHSQGAESKLLHQQLARQILEHCSDDCRQLLKAYFFEQRSYEEIAQQMGVPVGTVKSRLSRCLEKAQKLIRAPRPKHGRWSER